MSTRTKATMRGSQAGLGDNRQQDTWIIRYWTTGHASPVAPKRAAATRGPVEDDITRYVRHLQSIAGKVMSLSIQMQTQSSGTAIAQPSMGSIIPMSGASTTCKHPLVIRPSRKAEAHVITALISILRASSMSELDLGIKLQDTTAYKHLAEAISGCTSLRKLSLAGSQAGDAAVEMLRPVLQHSSSLQLLDLSKCCLTDAAADSLAAMIKVQAGEALWNALQLDISSYWLADDDRICTASSSPSPLVHRHTWHIAMVFGPTSAPMRRAGSQV